MNEIRAYYVDDEVGEAGRYKYLLEQSGRMKVEVVQPKKDIGQAMPTDNPDVLLVDQALDIKQEGSEDDHVSYKGTTLTTAIKERMPDYPVVLVTKESIVSARRRRQIQSELQVVDDIVYKSEIYKNPEGAVARILGLAAGFKSLRQIAPEERTWENLLSVLRASPEEAQQLKRAAPPLFGSTWDISLIADWIRGTLIEYPGVLYDPVFASTELRISQDAFAKPEVQEVFEDAKYDGVFAPQDGRWWKERLWRIAMRYVEGAQFSEEFATVFRERTHIELEPSRSIVRGEIPADTVCYIYHKPVMYKYTVAYRADNRPPVMDPPRVSFKAIQQSNEVQMALVEGVTDELLERIREMEL